MLGGFGKAMVGMKPPIMPGQAHDRRDDRTGYRRSSSLVRFLLVEVGAEPLAFQCLRRRWAWLEAGPGSAG